MKRLVVCFLFVVLYCFSLNCSSLIFCQTAKGEEPVSPGIVIKRQLDNDPLPFSKDLKDEKKGEPMNITEGHSPLSNTNYLLTSFLVLVVICILAYFSIKFFFRNSGALNLRGKKLIRFIERMAFSPQKSLMIFQVAGRYYLVGVTEQGMNLLAELDQAAVTKELEVASQDSASPSFSQYLAGLGFGNKQVLQNKEQSKGMEERHGE